MSLKFSAVPVPVLALRASLRNLWLADAVLAGQLGGDKIYDMAPRGVIPPYLTFGEVRAKQWLGGSQRGFEQELEVIVWSRQVSDKESLEIAGRLGQISDGALLVLAGHQVWPLQVTDIHCPSGHPQGWRQAIMSLRVFTAPSG